jgi:hypothetical protein
MANLINPNMVQCGDQISINNNPVMVTYISKDIHGFDTYVRDSTGNTSHVFIPEEDKVKLIG